MLRSAATPRVSNHEATEYAVMILSKWHPLKSQPAGGSSFGQTPMVERASLASSRDR
jgi:hypothetical protein